MPLDDTLLEVLACPIDKGPLLHFPQEALLYNPRLRRAFPVVDDIPILLVDHAVATDTGEHERLLDLAERGGAHVTQGRELADVIHHKPSPI